MIIGGQGPAGPGRGQLQGRWSTRNSTVIVTRAIDEAMAPLRIPGGPDILCLTLEEGPPGVEASSMRMG